MSIEEDRLLYGLDEEQELGVKSYQKLVSQGKLIFVALGAGA